MPHRMLLLLLSVLTLSLLACSSDNRREKSDQEVAITYLQMGVGYMELGKYTIAMERLQYSLKLDDENSGTHDALAILYGKLNDDKQAQYHFKQSLRLNSDNPSLKNNYGQFLCENGQYKEGVKFLQEALEMVTNTRKWFAYTNLGICEYKHGSRQQAEQYLREALQLFPQYAPALQQMIVVSFDNKNYISAKAFMERFLAVSKPTPQSYYYSMLIAQANGNRGKAARLKVLLIEKYPLSKEAALFQ